MEKAAQREGYFHKLVELMDILRGPNGCPWDKEQTRETLKPFLVEEAFEVLAALDSEEPAQLREELGDLLLQVLFHSRISKERREFDIHDVCRTVYEKMVRRHPHVFGDAHYSDARELLRDWEDLKAAEKEISGRKSEPRTSLLDGIPARLPAVYTTYQISAKAARVGFDWPDVRGLRTKLDEEFEELLAALQAGDESRVKDEVGDLLFTAVNVARFLEIDPETALHRANEKFSRRFRAMEEHFASRGQTLKEVSVEEMESFWRTEARSRESGVKSEKPELNSGF